jgi:hypothetical protein
MAYQSSNYCHCLEQIFLNALATCRIKRSLPVAIVLGSGMSNTPERFHLRPMQLSWGGDQRLLSKLICFKEYFSFLRNIVFLL